MSDYTPTTAKMFEAYYNYLRHTSRTSRDAEAEFDRWLAEVKAEAWQEGTHAMSLELQYHFGDNHKCVTNPYRQGEN